MKYLLILFLASCATIPKPPEQAPEKTPVQEEPSKAVPCARGSWCQVWTDTVKQKITPNLLNANYSSFCSNYQSLDKQALVLNFVKAVTYAESAWNPKEVYVEKTMGIDPITGRQVESDGMWQLSCQDPAMSAYKNLPTASEIDCRKNPNAIFDPVTNLKFGMEILNYWVGRSPGVDVSSKSSGGAYWSSMRIGHDASRKKLKALMAECK